MIDDKTLDEIEARAVVGGRKKTASFELTPANGVNPGTISLAVTGRTWPGVFEPPIVRNQKGNHVDEN